MLNRDARRLKPARPDADRGRQWMGSEWPRPGLADDDPPLGPAHATESPRYREPPCQDESLQQGIYIIRNMYIYSIYPAARPIHSPPIIDFILGTGKILDSIIFMNTIPNAIQLAHRVQRLPTAASATAPRHPHSARSVLGPGFHAKGLIIRTPESLRPCWKSSDSSSVHPPIMAACRIMASQ